MPTEKTETTKCPKCGNLAVPGSPKFMGDKNYWFCACGWTKSHIQHVQNLGIQDAWEAANPGLEWNQLDFQYRRGG